MSTYKVTLKSIKYSGFASQETSCYQANIYWDGKKVGTIENSGHGGGDDARVDDSPAGKEMMAVLARDSRGDENIWAKNDSHRAYWVLEKICGDLLMAHLILKDLKKLTNSLIIYTKKGSNAIWQTGIPKNKANKAETLKRWAAEIAAEADTDQVLNTMPIPEAIQVFRDAD